MHNMVTRLLVAVALFWSGTLGVFAQASLTTNPAGPRVFGQLPNGSTAPGVVCINPTTGTLESCGGGGGGGGTLSIAPVAPTVSATGAVTSLVLKASATSNPGGVAYFHAENGTGNSGYCVLYNATAAPAPGALTAGLVLGFQLLPGNGYCDLDRTLLPIAASVGAVVLLTSAVTPYTYTTGSITGSIFGVAQ